MRALESESKHNSYHEPLAKLFAIETLVDKVKQVVDKFERNQIETLVARHMIIEKMPAILNTQVGMENLFRKILPSKMRSLSKWKSVDIQRVSVETEDLERISNYLSKQCGHSNIPLESLSSDLTRNQSLRSPISRTHK